MPAYGEGDYGSGLYGDSAAGYGAGPFGEGAYGGLTSSDDQGIVWGSLLDRGFEAGVDRGVLYPKSAPAVAWNGLISVNENGGEGSTVYYQDGRPFLHVPIPKEYSGTIEAYTYPDEFNDMMGYAEVAEGMYVDSQQADSFDLSYRTMVGNAVDGGTQNYKLHLIYNATVTTPSFNYATLSDSLEPMNLSWEIQAVPENIAGHRPTAHLIIDTRKMSAANLALIEDRLYGRGELEPYMPKPQYIFELLGFTQDLVTITDNGDGTWTATGSSDNIQVFADGTFLISNVDAVIHGDGTYTISGG